MGKKDQFCMKKGVGLPVVVVTPAVESLLGLRADPPPPSIYSSRDDQNISNFHFLTHDPHPLMNLSILGAGGPKVNFCMAAP